MERLVRWVVSAGVLGFGACVPPSVYTISIASSPGRVTYAQRNPEKTQSDYLVDCEMTPVGTQGCRVVTLPGAQ